MEDSDERAPSERKLFFEDTLTRKNKDRLVAQPFFFISYNTKYIITINILLVLHKLNVVKQKMMLHKSSISERNNMISSNKEESF